MMSHNMNLPILRPMEHNSRTIGRFGNVRVLEYSAKSLRRHKPSVKQRAHLVTTTNYVAGQG